MTKNRNAKLAAKNSVRKDNVSYAEAITKENRLIDPAKCRLVMNPDKKILRFSSENEARNHPVGIYLGGYEVEKFTTLSEDDRRVIAKKYLAENGYFTTAENAPDGYFSTPIDVRSGPFRSNEYGLPGNSRIFKISGRPGSGKTVSLKAIAESALSNGTRVIALQSHSEDFSMSMVSHSSFRYRLGINDIIDPFSVLGIDSIRKLGEKQIVDFLLSFFVDLGMDTHLQKIDISMTSLLKRAIVFAMDHGGIDTLKDELSSFSDLLLSHMLDEDIPFLEGLSHTLEGCNFVDLNKADMDSDIVSIFVDESNKHATSQSKAIFAAVSQLDQMRSHLVILDGVLFEEDSSDMSNALHRNGSIMSIISQAIDDANAVAVSSYSEIGMSMGKKMGKMAPTISAALSVESKMNLDGRKSRWIQEWSIPGLEENVPVQISDEAVKKFDHRNGN